MQIHTEIENQKVTAYLPKKALKLAQEFTGAGITETLRLGIEELTRKKAYRDFAKLRGTYKFSLSLDELRQDDE